MKSLQYMVAFPLPKNLCVFISVCRHREDVRSLKLVVEIRTEVMFEQCHWRICYFGKKLL